MATEDIQDIQLLEADGEVQVVTITGSAPGNAHVIDMVGYASLTVTIVSGAASEKQIIFQSSEDGETSWINTPTAPIGAPSGNGVDLSIWTSNAKLIVPRRGRYIRMLRAGTDTTGDIIVHYSQSSAPVSLLNLVISGPVADSAAASGYPVPIGGNVFDSAASTLVAGDRAILAVTTARQLVTTPFAPAELNWQAASAELTTTTEAQLKGAVSGFRNYITGLQIQNTHAATATVVEVRDGAGGTVIWRGKLNPGMSVFPSFQTPLRGSVNTTLYVACVTSGASVYVSAQGFVSV